MPTEDILNRANFGLLPEEKFSWGSFGAATVIEVIVASLLLMFTMSELNKAARIKHFETTQLVFPTEIPKVSPPPKIPTPKVVAPPKVELAKLAAPKIALPKQEIVKPPEPKIELAKAALPELPPAAPKLVKAAPQAKLTEFATNHPTTVANNTVAPTAKAGGFGNPVGAAVNPNAASSKMAAPAAGSFSNAPGVGAEGAGGARKGSATAVGSFNTGVANGVPGGNRGTVASAGLSNGMIGGTPGGVPGGHASSGAFGGPQYGGAAAPLTAKVDNFTPPEVTFKPNPQYTPDAKQAGVQGDVVLQVTFKASGQVIVVGVKQGLGHGLDDAAKRVAEQIRFKPATRNGQPVDHTTFIHVTFQLA